MPDLRGGAITAEDLEASFLTDPDSGLSTGESDGDSRPRLPPGFGAPPQRPPQVGLLPDLREAVGVRAIGPLLALAREKKLTHFRLHQLLNMLLPEVRCWELLRHRHV